MLEANSQRPARERLTAQRLFELLRAEGYAGAYDSVQRHVREWRRQQSRLGPVFIPLWFAPGEAYQFDWSHEVVVLGGVTTTVKVAHIRLCHSRMFLVRAYRTQAGALFPGGRIPLVPEVFYFRPQAPSGAPLGGASG